MVRMELGNKRLDSNDGQHVRPLVLACSVRSRCIPFRWARPFLSRNHVSDQGVVITCLWHAFGGRSRVTSHGRKSFVLVSFSLLATRTQSPCFVAPFLRSLIFFRSVDRREYLIHRVVQFLSAWSLRHPRFFRYAVFLSSGEVVLCADPGGLCSGPYQIWGFFLYCHFIISNALAQLLSRIFVSFGRSRSEPTLWNCFWR
eukprot:30900_1